MKRTLTPMEGVRIRPLARSSDQLPTDLPGSETSSLTKFQGGTVLSIDSVAKPGLFHPKNFDAETDIEISHAPCVDVDAVCCALALEYNTCVEQGRQWNHYPLLGGLPETNHTVLQERGVRTSYFSEQHRLMGMNWSDHIVALTGESEPIPEIDENGSVRTQLYSRILKNMFVSQLNGGWNRREKATNMINSSK